VQPKIKKNQEKENTDNIINGYSPPALHPHHNSTVWLDSSICLLALGVGQGKILSINQTCTHSNKHYFYSFCGICT
jgi:hypothetical protein